MENNRLKLKNAEIAHEVIVTTLELIPNCGDRIAKLFNLVAPSPYKKRLENFLAEVDRRLKLLEATRKIQLSDLESDEFFLSMLAKTADIAIKNHQVEKIKHCVNIVVNSITEIDMNEDLKLLFADYIDVLTPSHIKLLDYFADQESNLINIDSYQQLFQKFTEYTCILMETDYFKTFCEGLITRNLIQISSSVDDFSTVYKSIYLTDNDDDNAPKFRVTSIGKLFLRFIANLQE